MQVKYVFLSELVGSDSADHRKRAQITTHDKTQPDHRPGDELLTNHRTAERPNVVVDQKHL